MPENSEFKFQNSLRSCVIYQLNGQKCTVKVITLDKKSNSFQAQHFAAILCILQSTKLISNIFQRIVLFTANFLDNSLIQSVLFHEQNAVCKLMRMSQCMQKGCQALQLRGLYTFGPFFVFISQFVFLFFALKSSIIRKKNKIK